MTKDNDILGDYTVTGFPLGIALLGYMLFDSSVDPSTQYVVFDRPWTPLNISKGQRIGELNMIGRNTPVLQSFGGKGMDFPDFKGTIKQEDAHDVIIRLSGWVDHGAPLYFAVDKWIRKVILVDFKPVMQKYHGWYEFTLYMKKYEAIKPLSYLRAINDLAPTPTFPEGTETGTGSTNTGSTNPLDPKNTKGENGDYEEIKNADGELVFKVKKTNKCRMITINEGDTWEDLILANYTPPLTKDDTKFLQMAIICMNSTNSNSYQVGADGKMHPTTPFSICFPNELISYSGKTYKTR